MGNHVTPGKIYDNGPAGWTSITPSTTAGGDTFDTNIIYVSDSIGSDLRDGSTPGFTDDNSTVQFVVTSANATVGATYTNNAQTFTVAATIAAKTFLKMTSRTGSPAASGTLTKATGTGDATITFSTFALGIHGPVKTLIKAIGGTGPGSYDPDHNSPSNGDGSGLGAKGAGNGFGLRPGKPDWVLLLLGDTWTNQCFEKAYDQTNGSDAFPFHGFSAQEPLLISSYDPALPTTPNPGTGARPIVVVPGGSGGTTAANSSRDGLKWTGLNAAGGCLSVIGIEFYCAQRDPGSGSYLGPSITDGNCAITCSNANHDLYVEDNKYSYFYQAMAIGGGINPPAQQGGVNFTNLTIRRCVAWHNWGLANFRGQGYAIDAVTGFRFEENVTDNCGNYTALDGGSSQGRNHYFQWDTANVVARGNISARSASEGFQFRGGGVIEENCLIRNGNGFDVGHPEGQPTITYAAINYNVITESRDTSNGSGLDAGGPRGDGIFFNNALGPGIQGTGNIITHGASATSTNAFVMQTDAFAGSGSVTAGTHGVVNFGAGNILYDWQNGSALGGTGKVISDLGSSDGHGAANDFSGCAKDLLATNGAGYIDPTVTAGSYAGTLGLTATYDGLLTACRGQSKTSWNPALTARAINDYFRRNYNMPRKTRNLVGGF